MKFGVRQCANIVFRAKQEQMIGSQKFHVGQPVLYIDSATTASIEQSTTTVYAQGGRGNVRLVSWEGEKTVTFSFTDALLSPIGFSILSGAGLFKRGNGDDSSEEGSQSSRFEVDLVHFHTYGLAPMVANNGALQIELDGMLAEYRNAGVEPKICIDDAPIYIMGVEGDGSVTGVMYTGSMTLANGKSTGSKIRIASPNIIDGGEVTSIAAVDVGKHQKTVMVDFYIDLPGKNVWEADITAETFGGNYYVEADTLFRDTTGRDLAANLTFPNVKIQSNFTMTFAATGDPSTFDFTCDAFPDFTYFDTTKKVICVLQVIDYNRNDRGDDVSNPVMPHTALLEHDADGLGDDIWDRTYTEESRVREYPSNIGATSEG